MRLPLALAVSIVTSSIAGAGVPEVSRIVVSPAKPAVVAGDTLRRSAQALDAGCTLHDIDVQNGLVYVGYRNDGLVILDVGNGMKGGSPRNPQLVSQHKATSTSAVETWRQWVARASSAAHAPPDATRTTSSRLPEPISSSTPE